MTHKDFEEFNENVNFDKIMNKQKKIDALIKEKMGSGGNVYESAAYLLSGIILGFFSVVVTLIFLQDPGSQSSQKRSK